VEVEVELFSLLNQILGKEDKLIFVFKTYNRLRLINSEKSIINLSVFHHCFFLFSRKHCLELCSKKGGIQIEKAVLANSCCGIFS
jgi:hypothetical protein